MNKKQAILARVIPIGILAFILTALITYQRGVWDFTFIERPETTAQPETTNDSPTPKETSQDQPTHEETEPAPETEAAPIVDLIDKFLNTVPATSELITAGYNVSENEFTDGFVLARLDAALPLSSEYSKRFRIEKMPDRIPDDTYNTYSTVMRDVVAEVPSAEVYMDYIFIDNGTTVDVFTGDGTLLVSGFDTSVYVPTYTRDKNDRPLFKAQEPSRYNPKNLITKYYYIESDGSMKTSDYSEVNDSRGLYVNYPSSFGKTDNSIYRFYDKTEKLYGYGSRNGHMRTEYKYSHAYNFNNGLACAVETDGLMYFIGEHMYNQISGSVQIFKNYNSARRRLLREYVMPDTFGEESLGFFYFDHGLVRVRLQVVDAYHWIEYQHRFTASDSDILIRTDGSEYPLPTDYELVSYSNGMILLKKDDKYGYMDYTGKWILQPVYTYAKPFHEGLAVVGYDNKVGVINTDGEFVIPMIFEKIGNTSGGVTTAWSSTHGWVIFNKLEPSAAE